MLPPRNSKTDLLQKQ